MSRAVHYSHSRHRPLLTSLTSSSGRTGKPGRHIAPPFTFSPGGGVRVTDSYTAHCPFGAAPLSPLARQRGGGSSVRFLSEKSHLLALLETCGGNARRQKVNNLFI